MEQILNQVTVTKTKKTKRTVTQPLQLGVVIVTYNSADALRELLDSLEQALAGIERTKVLIVDNLSSDNSVEIGERHPLAPTVIRNSTNAGYSAAINIAAGMLPPEADMLILNPDIRLLPGSVAKLLAAARSEDVGVVTPLILNSDGSIATSLRREPRLIDMWCQAILGPAISARLGVGEAIARPAAYGKPCTVDWATGAILLVSSRARQRVGQWDESFFLYSEEVDYQRRVREAGLRVVFEPAAHAFHAGGEYQRNVALTSVLTSNQIRYFARHHGPLQTALFRTAIIIFGLLRAWRSRAHRASILVALLPLRPARDYMSWE